MGGDVVERLLPIQVRLIVGHHHGQHLDAAIRPFPRNDLVEGRGHSDTLLPVARRHPHREVIWVAHAIAVAVKDRAAEHVDLAVFLRPETREPLQDLPHAPIKLAKLGGHVRHQERVVDRKSALGDVGARGQMALVEDRLVVVGGTCGRLLGEPRISSETVGPIDLTDSRIDDVVSCPDGDAQAAIVLDDIVALDELDLVGGGGLRPGRAPWEVLAQCLRLFAGAESESVVCDRLFARAAKVRRDGALAGQQHQSSYERPYGAAQIADRSHDKALPQRPNRILSRLKV